MDTIVLGAGMTGLAAALMLARDGHRVTVLERDPAPVPDAPGADWDRGGVAQFRQAHLLQPRGRQVLEAELPDVFASVVASGARRLDLAARMPATIADRSPRPGDERFETWTLRRTLLEQVLARAAEREVDVRRGVPVAWLEVSGRRVRGVRDALGTRHAADLVIDAMGRSSVLPRLLGDAVAEEDEGGGFLYYTRYFRGRVPEFRGAVLSHVGPASIVTIPAERDLWSITLVVSARHRELRRLRAPSAFDAFVRSLPQHAHWLYGAPASDVLTMGGKIGRRRTIDPGLTGVVSLGDAWAYTNPSLGRGMTLGLMHASLLRRHGPDGLADATERELLPWYRSTVATDRARHAEIEALLDGAAPPPVDRVRAALPLAALRDAEVFRAMSEIAGCLTLPQDVLSRPGLTERILAAGEEPLAVAS